MDRFNNAIASRLEDIFDVNVLGDEELEEDLKDAMKQVVNIDDVRRTTVVQNF
jgi:hypothetical protein